MKQELNQTVTFLFLATFTGFILVSFVLYGIRTYANEISWELLAFNIAILAHYASIKQVKRAKNQPGRMPGQIFVYLTWFVTAFMGFCSQFGFFNITRFSIWMVLYAVAVTTVYGGSEFLRLYKDGYRFLTEKK